MGEVNGRASMGMPVIGENFSPRLLGIFHRVVIGDCAHLPGTPRAFMLDDTVLLDELQGKSPITAEDRRAVTEGQTMGHW